MTNITLINTRQDIRGIARILCCPRRLEPDINEVYSPISRIWTMSQFLKKVRPQICFDEKGDSDSGYLMMLTAKPKGESI